MAYGKVQDPAVILKAKLKEKKAPGGVWLLCGEESYLSDYYAGLFRKKIIPDPDLGYFDHICLSGSDRTDTERSLAERIQDACAGLPVMADSKLIDIREPRFADMGASEVKDLCTVLETVPDYPYVTVLFTCAGEEFETDYKSRLSPLWKGLEKAGVQIMVFEQQTPQKLIPWCGKHFAKEGIEAAPSVIDAMLRITGTSMAALAGEIDKLCCYEKAHGRSVVSAEDVQSVCALTESAVDFAIQSAVRARDVQELLSQYAVRKHKKEEPIALFFQISSAIAELYRIKIAVTDGYAKEDIMRIYKMKEYPVRLAMQGCTRYSLPALRNLMERCAETDLALKSSALDGYLLIERLICSVSKTVMP